MPVVVQHLPPMLLRSRSQPHASGYRRSPAVTIRWSTSDDARSVSILADLDEAPVPAAPILLAFVGEELWVAMSLSTGDAVSDPFRPSAEVVALVRERARQLSVPELSRPRVGAMRWPRRLPEIG
jgi:hypothetical protein